MDWGLALAGLGIGVIVGLTGMGGGALMTPVLVLFFGISPLTAVSSDLITSAFMKPVGSVVHMRHGTVHWKIVLWLVVGSVPAAFSGALIISAIGPMEEVNNFVKTALGVVLLIASALLIVRAYIAMRTHARIMRGEEVARPEVEDKDIKVKIFVTIVVGVVEDDRWLPPRRAGAHVVSAAAWSWLWGPALLVGVQLRSLVRVDGLRVRGQPRRVVHRALTGTKKNRSGTELGTPYLQAPGPRPFFRESSRETWPRRGARPAGRAALRAARPRPSPEA